MQRRNSLSADTHHFALLLNIQDVNDHTFAQSTFYDNFACLQKNQHADDHTFSLLTNSQHADDHNCAFIVNCQPADRE